MEKYFGAENNGFHPEFFDAALKTNKEQTGCDARNVRKVTDGER